ncbi:nucleolar protein 12 [Musca vetustissima]|uniref:nucleolar protein 12 n=1 Tax=Musca vetustissima TaxID=27455 RepID=UPI002AB7A27F|nr:nucleolar protein 12 [Musca vetustissima]
MARKKNPKKKLEIVFDPQKRKEFLTGFRKRKNERRKRAQEELERNLKEERRRIRLEIKDGIKHMKKSFEPLKELTEADKRNEDEYEDDDVKVKIVELSTGDLAAQRNMLGVNRGEESEESEKDAKSDDDEEENNSPNCIPGMDFDINAKKRKHARESDNDDGGDSDEEGAGGKSKKSKTEKEKLELKTKKELDHFKKVKTMKKLKKTKAFKMKQQLDKKANQKKARKDRNNTLKSLPAHLRKKKKFQKNPYSKGRLLNRRQIRKKNSSG